MAWIFALSIAALLAAGLGLIGSRDAYRWPRLTQRLAARRPLQIQVGTAAVGIALLWAFNGARVLSDVSYCAAAYPPARNEQIMVSVSQMGVDPYYARLTSDVLNAHLRIAAWPLTAEDVARCGSRFTALVSLHSEPVGGTNEVSYTATIARPGAAPRRVEHIDSESRCGVWPLLGHKAVSALGFTPDAIVANADNPLVLTGCQAYQLNAEGLDWYNTSRPDRLPQAKERLAEAIRLVPGYAAAHHNLALVYIVILGDL